MGLLNEGTRNGAATRHDSDERPDGHSAREAPVLVQLPRDAGLPPFAAHEQQITPRGEVFAGELARGGGRMTRSR